MEIFLLLAAIVLLYPVAVYLRLFWLAFSDGYKRGRESYRRKK